MMPSMSNPFFRGNGGRPAPAAAPVAQGPPPVDPGNGCLRPVDVAMDLRRHVIEDVSLTMAHVCSAVPGMVQATAGGDATQVVIFTVRGAAQTFTCFWDRVTARIYVDAIRGFLAENMPVIIMPPGNHSPDLRRMIMGLSFLGTNESAGTMRIEFDAEHAAETADMLERALVALYGLQAP